MTDATDPSPFQRRASYEQGGLSSAEAGTCPMRLLETWITDAGNAVQHGEPTAACLSTVAADGTPSARVLLVRHLDAERAALHFFSSYASRKAHELVEHAAGALTFYWRELERQVRIIGRVERLDSASSDEYFRTRPRESQLSAHASVNQSAPVADRATLEQQLMEARERFAGIDVPRPDHWGGYALIADELEFWAGRPARLHDRIVFLRAGGVRSAATSAGTIVTDDHGISWRKLRLQP